MPCIILGEWHVSNCSTVAQQYRMCMLCQAALLYGRLTQSVDSDSRMCNGLAQLLSCLHAARHYLTRILQKAPSVAAQNAAEKQKKPQTYRHHLAEYVGFRTTGGGWNCVAGYQAETVDEDATVRAGRSG